MAFQNLRNGSKLYILHKGDGDIKMEIADVVNVTTPTLKFQTQQVGVSPQPPMQVVDISTKVGDASYNFPQVPALMDIIDYGINGNIVISASKDSMSQEINAIKGKAQDIIASVDKNKATIKSCDEIIAVLNPEAIRAEKAQEENKALRSELAEMRKMCEELMKAMGGEKHKKQSEK